MRVGFIGTGTMGTPIAGCLVAAGHQLTVYDIRHEATRTLQQQGAAIADTPRSVAQASEAVFTSLPGPFAVEKAALDPETGLLAGLSGGTLDIVAKDIDLACALAREVGAPVQLGVLASEMYKQAQARGWGQEGFPVVARVLEAMAGVELRDE